MSEQEDLSELPFFTHFFAWRFWCRNQDERREFLRKLEEFDEQGFHLVSMAGSQENFIAVFRGEQAVPDKLFTLAEATLKDDYQPPTQG